MKKTGLNPAFQIIHKPSLLISWSKARRSASIGKASAEGIGNKWENCGISHLIERPGLAEFGEIAPNYFTSSLKSRIKPSLSDYSQTISLNFLEQSEARCVNWQGKGGG